MRLKQYLKEAIIPYKAKELTLFKKLTRQANKDFVKGKHTTVINAMKWVAREMTKSIKDLEVGFKPTKSWNSKGFTMADDPKHVLGLEFNTKEAKSDWLYKQDFNDWLDAISDLFAHELVHINQFRKILKAKKDIQQVRDILSGEKFRLQDKHDDRMDQYLNDHIEIMAHAQKSDLELKHIPAKDVLNMLKNSNDMEELSMESSDFGNYYYHMKGNYPKTWKKFMKYFVMFLQKREKKEGQE